MATSQLKVKLIDGVSGPAKAAGASLRNLVGAAKHASTGIARAQQSLNRQIAANSRAMSRARWGMVDAAAVGYATYRALAKPVTAAMDYQTALEDIRQKTGGTKAETAALGEELRGLTKETNQTTSALLRAANAALGLAGDLPKAEQTALFKSAGRAATAYRADIEELARTGVAAFVNLNTKAKDLPKIYDILGFGAAKGGFEIPDLAQYFPDLAASYAAQAPGQDALKSVNEISAAVQTVRKATGDSAQAATYLRSVFQKFGDPSTTAAFEKFAGIDLPKRYRELKAEGLSAVDAMIRITEEATKGDEAMYSKLFGRVQTRLAMMALVRDQAGFREMRAGGADAAGFTDEQYERRVSTFAANMKRFKAQIENFSISLGNALLPAISDTVEGLGNLVEAARSFVDRFPALTKAVVAGTAALIGLRVAAAAANFGRLFAVGGLLRAKSAMLGIASAVTKIGAGFAALTGLQGAKTALGWLARTGVAFGVAGAGLAAIGAGIKFMADNWAGVKSFFGGVGSGFMSGIADAVGKENMAQIRGAVQDLKSILDFDLGISTERWRSWGQALGSIAGQGVGTLIDAVRTLVGWIRDAAGAARDLVNAFSGIGSISIKQPQIGGAARAMRSGTSEAVPAPSKPARAVGGPVTPGQSYIVGERGPELFRPRRSGSIDPSGKRGGGGVTVSPTFNFRINGEANPSAIEAHVRRALDDYVSEAFRGVQLDAGAKVY